MNLKGNIVNLTQDDYGESLPYYPWMYTDFMFLLNSDPMHLYTNIFIAIYGRIR